ncbi:MAG TPA: ABC transporter permease [Candidatus Limnocylindrales bacterium]|nr:ABC transporter permease [Candidatus Limnocylindrales bacterium]
MDVLGGIAGWFADPAHWQGSAGVPARVGEHMALSAVALAIAAAIGLAAGTWVGHSGRGAALTSNLANLGRAFPTLAVMGVVVPVTAAIDNQAGFKLWPAIIALVVLAIPPILVNTYAGIAGVDHEVIEAGRAAGMRGWQVLWKLEVPLAIPVILTGVRSGASQIVATATLAAIFGGPGLGRYLVEGYAQLDYPMMWAGVILVGATFAVVEVALAGAQRALTSPGLRLIRAGRAA